MEQILKACLLGETRPQRWLWGWCVQSRQGWLGICSSTVLDSGMVVYSPWRGGDRHGSEELLSECYAEGAKHLYKGGWDSAASQGHSQKGTKGMHLLSQGPE